MRISIGIPILIIITITALSCRQDLSIHGSGLCSLNLEVAKETASGRFIHEDSQSLTISLEYDGFETTETVSLTTGEASIRLERLPVGEATLKVTTQGSEKESPFPLSGCEKTVILQEGENRITLTLSNLIYEISGIIYGIDSLPLSEQQIILSDDNPETADTALLTGTQGQFTFSLDTKDLDSLIHFSWMGYTIDKTKKDLIQNRANLSLFPEVMGGLSIPVVTSIMTTASGTVTLNWSSVEDAESYLVKYSTINNPDSAITVSPLIDLDMTDTTAAVTGLTNEDFYYFWVSAHNSQAQSSLNSSSARMIPLDGSGTDHAGADWTPSGVISGVHYNIGNLSIPFGTTVSGSFTVYAETVNIAGTVNATGYGYSGGSGGAIGTGGYGRPNIMGQAGGSGSNGDGPSGAGTGASGNSGGTGGNAGQDLGPSNGSDGSPGGNGTTGQNATYVSSGFAGDELLNHGTGGGGGGAGGGGGGLDIINASQFGGNGGAGGNGATGGGLLKFYSFSTLTISGSILSNTGSPGSGSTGNPRTGASSANYFYGGAGGDGASGGYGSGGGILLKGVDLNLSGATIQSLGSGGNAATYGGDMKIHYEKSLDDSGSISVRNKYTYQF